VLAAALGGTLLLVPGAPAGARPAIGVYPAAVVTALPLTLQRPAQTTTEDYLPRMRERVTWRAQIGALGPDVSVYVADLETGARVLGRRGGNPQIPASNMKSVTALAALSARGADYRPATTVTWNPVSRQLTVVGGGDPLLDSDDLRALAADTAAAIRTAGEPEERIRLRVDDSLFQWPTPPAGWPSSYYTAYADRPFALTRRWASVADGTIDAARFFRSALAGEGLRLRKYVGRAQAPGDPVIARFEEHTIGDAVAAMMPPSDNSIAENLIRHVAAARGFPTTAEGSAAAVTAELATLGIPMARVRIVDGSGLSTSNRVTAKALVAVTRAMMDPQRPDLAAGVHAMPRAGIDGTLAPPRFGASTTRCARNRVMAKTGTLRSSVALSGIAAATDGRPKVFSILVNSYPTSTTTTRYWVDRIATAITGCR
jgi:D-alanyl-D-alanine carboxypeptidase/D-alanyl-D-alanine-endopeptidase (penicillin-binding protein 4)